MYSRYWSPCTIILVQCMISLLTVCVSCLPSYEAYPRRWLNNGHPWIFHYNELWKGGRYRTVVIQIGCDADEIHDVPLLELPCTTPYLLLQGNTPWLSVFAHSEKEIHSAPQMSLELFELQWTENRSRHSNSLSNRYPISDAACTPHAHVVHLRGGVIPSTDQKQRETIQNDRA